MSKIKKIGLAGVVLAIVFVVAFICFNRKEQNKIEEKETKKNECAEMQLFEYPTQYSQVSGNHYFYLRKNAKGDYILHQDGNKEILSFRLSKRCSPMVIEII